jgi:hypothetical protein
MKVLLQSGYMGKNMKPALGIIGLIRAAVLVGVLAPLEAHAVSCPSVSDISLDADQAQLILEIKNRDELANTGAIFSLLGPALDCIASHPADCLFSVSPGDWDQISSTPGNLTKIAASVDYDEIDMYMFHHPTASGKGKTFLVCLQKYYAEIKSR